MFTDERTPWSKNSPYLLENGDQSVGQGAGIQNARTNRD